MMRTLTILLFLSLTAIAATPGPLLTNPQLNGSVEYRSTAPEFEFAETDAGTDEKVWRFTINNGVARWVLADDNDESSTAILTIDRDGAEGAAITLNAEIRLGEDASFENNGENFRAALALNKTILNLGYSSTSGVSTLTPSATVRFFHRYRWAPGVGSGPWTRRIVLAPPNDGNPAELWFRLEMPESENPTVEFYSLTDSREPIAIFRAADYPGGVAWAHFWFGGTAWVVFAAGWN